MNRGSPYFTHVLSDQLRGLSNRIAGTSHSDKSGSWVSSKIGKPSLDSIGGWLEGRFTKLVTGDEDNADESKERKSEEQGFVGPFSSYSAMSSATPSNDPSPQSSVVNLNSYAPSHSTYVPNRTGSSMSNRSLRSNGIPPPQERAASAMDYAPRRKASPGPKIASASASTTTFAQSRSYGQSMYSPPGTAKQDQITPRSSTDISEEDEGQEVSWWGGDNGRTPTTANFMQFSADHAPVASSEGFISLMDNSNFAAHPQPSSSLRNVQHSSVEEEEEEDLGFGNSKKPQPKSLDREGDDSKESAAKEKVPASAAPQRPGNISFLVISMLGTNTLTQIPRLHKLELTLTLAPG
jgi:COPII coat assembly protein SEC16